MCLCERCHDIVVGCVPFVGVTTTIVPRPSEVTAITPSRNCCHRRKFWLREIFLRGGRKYVIFGGIFGKILVFSEATELLPSKVAER